MLSGVKNPSAMAFILADGPAVLEDFRMSMSPSRAHAMVSEMDGWTCASSPAFSAYCQAVIAADDRRLPEPIRTDEGWFRESGGSPTYRAGRPSGRLRRL